MQLYAGPKRSKNQETRVLSNNTSGKWGGDQQKEKMLREKAQKLGCPFVLESRPALTRLELARKEGGAWVQAPCLKNPKVGCNPKGWGGKENKGKGGTWSDRGRFRSKSLGAVSVYKRVVVQSGSNVTSKQ